VKYRSASILALAVLVTGCDLYVSPKEHHARLELADYQGWVRAKADSRDENLRKVGTVLTGYLGVDDEVSLPLEITGAHEALVIGACDQQCSDLDLRIVTASGRTLEVDDDPDAIPRIHVDLDAPTTLTLKVRMSRCSSGRCAFAIAQYEYEDDIAGSGTCFAVSPHGLLMTSLHVVDRASKITVKFPDGRQGEATVLRRSRDNDLVVLRSAISTPTWLPLASSKDFTAGTEAFTVGFPSPGVLGSEVKFTDGHVSALAGLRRESTLIQVSMPIQDGNSGGPVVSYSGRVLGIVESTVETDSQGNPLQLANFARHAQVAALLLPTEPKLPAIPAPRSREEAVERAMKAVCKVETE
jgi:hypothetical protein